MVASKEKNRLFLKNHQISTQFLTYKLLGCFLHLLPLNMHTLKLFYITERFLNYMQKLPFTGPHQC